MTEYEKPVLVSTEDACTPVIRIGLLTSFLSQLNNDYTAYEIKSKCKKESDCSLSRLGIIDVFLPFGPKVRFFCIHKPAYLIEKNA